MMFPDFSKLADGLTHVETFGKECLIELRAIRASLDALVQKQQEKDNGK